MITRCQPLLGTFVEITAPAGMEAAVGAAFAAVRHVHDHMSFHEPDSDLARICRAEPGEVVAVDHTTIVVLRQAAALYLATDGLFDVTVARELVAAGLLPRLGIPDLRRFTGTTADIEILGDTQLRCRRRLLVDLGGIAKGYAVDRATECLISAGAGEGLVNAGGDMRLFGPRPWPVQLRGADGSLGGTVMLVNCAVASSANLQFRRQYRGRTITPHFGRHRQPVLADTAITVVAGHCLIADAMTKIAMIDPDLANKLLLAHRGYVMPRAAQQMSRAAA
jgi:thiamine biosynthesis lipoprotein